MSADGIKRPSKWDAIRKHSERTSDDYGPPQYISTRLQYYRQIGKHRYKFVHFKNINKTIIDVQMALAGQQWEEMHYFEWDADGDLVNWLIE